MFVCLCVCLAKFSLQPRIFGEGAMPFLSACCSETLSTSEFPMSSKHTAANSAAVTMLPVYVIVGVLSAAGDSQSVSVSGRHAHFRVGLIKCHSVCC